MTKKNKKFTRSEFLFKSVIYSFLLVIPKFLKAQTPNPFKSRFNNNSTAEGVTEGLDLTGKTILITGANSGLGYESMRVLAMRGAHILAAARTMKKAKEAAASVKGKVTPLVCELTDFNSIINCAKTVEKLKKPLDVLMCNAGIMELPELQTVNGIEKQFVVNYLGHFLLTQRLLPLLQAAPQGRLVMLSSGRITEAPKSGIEFNNLSGRKFYDPLTAYGQSKLAAALFAMEFSRRFSKGKVTANALKPGVINTNLMKHQPWYKKVVILLISWAIWKSVEEGAATQCYVATQPSLKNVSGHFFSDCNPIIPKSPHFSNYKLSAKLWDVSLNLTSEYLK